MSNPTCRKCGHPIAFKRLPSGKMCPTNPDGTDHWDLCRGVTRTFPQAVRRCIEEGGGKSASHAKYVWCGDVPPWDESLGPYRDFTPEEIAEGKVCRLLTDADRAPTEFTRAELTRQWQGTLKQ